MAKLSVWRLFMLLLVHQGNSQVEGCSSVSKLVIFNSSSNFALDFFVFDKPPWTSLFQHLFCVFPLTLCFSTKSGNSAKDVLLAFLLFYWTAAWYVIGLHISHPTVLYDFPIILGHMLKLSTASTVATKLTFLRGWESNKLRQKARKVWISRGNK